MWGTNGVIGPVFLVKQDKLHPNRGQYGTGDSFSESGTVPLKAGWLDSLLNNNLLQNDSLREHGSWINYYDHRESTIFLVLRAGYYAYWLPFIVISPVYSLLHP